MHSVYFRDPLGLLVELACYRFYPPNGFSHADVLIEAHRIRSAKGDKNISEDHLSDAIEGLIKKNKPSLSVDRSPKNSYS